MRLESIEELEDPRVAAYRYVKDSTLRDTHGFFVVESRLCVRRLLAESRFPVRSVLVTNTALDGLRDVLADLGDETPVYVASQALLARVIGYDLHRGCIALAERGTTAVLGEIDLILNTPLGRDSYFDEKSMRQAATQRGIPLVTTLSGGHAMVQAIRALRQGRFDVFSLQELYPERAR